MTSTIIQSMKQSQSALKELVAQCEGRLFAIKHDHFAMQDARAAIRRLDESIALAETLEYAARGREIKLAMAQANDERLDRLKAEKQEVVWHLAKDGLPPIGSEVIGGHYYTDTWLKDRPEVFAWGLCRVISDDHPDFKDGKRWNTFGPSHNQITHWCWPPRAPKDTAPQPTLYTKDIDGNFHEYA